MSISKRKNLKKQTLKKEIDFLEKYHSEKDELTAFSEKVDSDLAVPARRQMKNIEVPTGEKRYLVKKNKNRKKAD